MIKNGSDTLLNAGSGTLPDVSSAFLNWFQPMIFLKIVKTILNFELVETATAIEFRGVWQPLSTHAVNYKPEGQRHWKWFQVHTDTAIDLSPDEVITYQGNQYRIKGNMNYDEYGYIKYELIEDFTGSGPTVIS